jgi:lysophospholipase L1-like esterase
MKRKKIFFLSGTVLAVLLLFACMTEKKTNDKPAFYAPMLTRSLISTGNNYRMKHVMEKAAKGEDVTIAYIGGSVTEGYSSASIENSYVNLSFASFKSLFAAGDGSNVHLVNAGMSGTPSTLGIIRYKRDVLDRAASPPDIVFMEFAINDADDPTNGAVYESLVHEILKAGNAPVVILLFSVIRSEWNLQDRFLPIGEDYGLPMISIKDALVPELHSGNIASDDFFYDEYHPTTFGHEIMADCITYYFSTVKDEAPAPRDINMPAKATIGTQFSGIRMIDAACVPGGITINAGSFSAKDADLGTFRYDPARKTFPDNWYKRTGEKNNPFIMTLTCRNLLLVYKKSSNSIFGTAEVYVDGNLTDTLDGNPSGAWNNPWTIVLLDNASSASHTIKIRMSADSATEYFTILAFGYTK